MLLVWRGTSCALAASAEPNTIRAQTRACVARISAGCAVNVCQIAVEGLKAVVFVHRFSAWLKLLRLRRVFALSEKGMPATREARTIPEGTHT